jgi:hypothetical protein
MNRIALKTLNKTTLKVKPNEDFELGESNSCSIKPKQVKKPEFYVSDQYGNFFCHYKNGLPYWSNKISEARELTEQSHFNTLVRWERGLRSLKQEWM